MRDPTYFCAQPLWRLGIQLEPGLEVFFESEEDALAGAQKMARYAAGAVAYSFEGRPEYGVRGVPFILAVFGELPDQEVVWAA